MPRLATMPRAYSYIRFSTPEQAEGDSLRRQLELSEEYAKNNKLLLDTSLKLRDLGKSAFSGYNRKKGALAVFLKAVEDRIVKPGSYLLVESLDRLSRDTLSAQMTLFMSLVNAGITVVTLADNQVYNTDNIDTDISRLMMSLVIMMRSHEESLTKSKRLLAAWKQKRADVATIKLTSVCPHWLVLNPDRKSFQVLEDRAALVRRIFQMSIDGIGQASPSGSSLFSVEWPVSVSFCLRFMGRGNGAMRTKAVFESGRVRQRFTPSCFYPLQTSRNQFY